MICEALQFNEEMIQVSLTRLIALAVQVVSRSQPEFTALERHAAFIDAWSIVDKMHNIRELALAGKKNIFTPDLVDGFIAAAKPITDLRNKMDHLHENVGNLGTKLKSGTLHLPLLGIIEFSWQRDPPIFDNGRPTLDVVVVIGSSVPFSFKETIGKGLRPVQRPPCDRFILHAFGTHVDLDGCGQSAACFCDVVAQGMEEGFERALEELRASGRDVSNLVTPTLPPTTLIYRATAPRPLV